MAHRLRSSVVLECFCLGEESGWIFLPPVRGGITVLIKMR